MKKLISLFTVLIFVISAFSACSPKGSDAALEAELQTEAIKEAGDSSEETVDEYVTPTEFTLPIAINDSINPYTAKSKQNKQLGTLIYESLFVLGNDFQPKYQLASLINGSKTEYIIVLRNGAKFSNGKAVTADDVVYSFYTAKDSPEYKGVFDNVESAGAVSGDVVFNLKKPDAYFANLLTFPVIPKNSKDKKSSSGRIDAPIGSGRYVYSYTAAEQTLVANEHYNGSASPLIKVIRLIDVPDNESFEYYIKTGRLSLCYTDFSNNDYTRLNGNSATVNLNNIVYLGINSKDENLSQKEVRRAVSFAINRQELCEKIFYETSEPANGLYNPHFKAINVSDDNFYLRQVDIAVEELNEIGYNSSLGDGIMRKEDTELAIRLLVNEDNSSRIQAAEQIANNLREVGFKVTVEKESFETYSHRIETLDYDLYIGEIKLNNNMDLSPLLNNEALTAYGVTDDATEKYNQFSEGKLSDEDFKNYIEDEMPVIPLLYRKGVLSYSKWLGNELSPAISDIFYGIEAWSYKTSK